MKKKKTTLEEREMKKNFNMSKGRAFLLCLVFVMFIFTSMYVIAIIKSDLDIIPVSACLTGIGTLAGLYIAGSVTDNGIKGHNWSQEMFDSENNKTGEKPK